MTLGGTVGHTLGDRVIDTVVQGDCLEVLRSMEAESVDAVVTDPPYELGFMGRSWDRSGIAYNVELWREVLRVLKPGGHLLAFGGTRTYHRMACAIEDAGFEVRDQMQWLYGSGFPKSLDISKAIDSELGEEREKVKLRGVNFRNPKSIKGGEGIEGGDRPWLVEARKNGFHEAVSSEAVSSEAVAWDGFGTALKPANEPICLARKPLSEKTVAKNVLKHGTGGLNIREGRIGERNQTVTRSQKSGVIFNGDSKGRPEMEIYDLGRWPSNVMLDEFAAEELDRQSGVCSSGESKPLNNPKPTKNAYGDFAVSRVNYWPQNDGGASRFFYIAKASGEDRPDYNNHPTVKPVTLMRHLIHLLTREGQVVLDPFAGSGTTGVACKKSGRHFILIEREEAYVKICQRRIAEVPDSLFD